MFNRSEVIVLTDRQTPLKTSTSLRRMLRRWVIISDALRSIETGLQYEHDCLLSIKNVWQTDHIRVKQVQGRF